ncbi:peptidase c56 [Niveomyces insectorum RCEF 264]|uniref:D-lactate dehydratase n=1 Tax=Niveomyces insectorum RCEF 264 TaxID=1081102 RepID=A0A167PW23_9HYPO|nr:peptidase c56 [Niveomyces insectorum RCEF 264]
MPPRKILVVLSSHDKIDSLDKPTGWFLPEFAHPYDLFAKAGFVVDVASPKGGKPPIDPNSLKDLKKDTVSDDFFENKVEVYGQTTPLVEIAKDANVAAATASKYDALFYPGGHGPLYDLAGDQYSHNLVAAFALQNKISLLAGRRVNGFTDEEERAVGLDHAVPFLVEKRLREIGAHFESAPAFQEKVVVDGNLITGQNPASAHAVGRAIVDELQRLGK